MAHLIVVLDTDVLIPLSVRDTILTAAKENLCTIRWTEEIIEEMRRTLVTKGFTTEGQAAWLIERMRGAFPDALITGYESEIARMTNDLDDRHVAAPACHARVDAIVTFILRHFPHTALAPFGLCALHPDAFLLECFAASPEMMVQIIRRQARERTRPIQTAVQILNGPAKLTPQFAAAIRERLRA